MSKSALGLLALLLLTGCWDRMPLRTLPMLDVAGIELDEKNKETILDLVITKYKKAGQGQAEPVSETTELRGTSLIEAIGKGEYIDNGRFLAISTRMYILGERFASKQPMKELAFLLNAPYASINSPVIVFEGDVYELLRDKSGTRKPLTKMLNDFINALQLNGTIPKVSMMSFILSQEEPLEDLALPLLKQYESGMEVDGALLFHQAKSTGAKLDREQLQMLMLMLGETTAKQRFTGRLPASGDTHPSSSAQTNSIDYGFSVQKMSNKITVQHEPNGLPKIDIDVRMKVYVFELDEGVKTMKSDYAHRTEKELGKHLEEQAAATIKTMQKANADVLGIGKQIKAFHRGIWNALDWRKDFPQLSIKPNINVEIMNVDIK